MGRSDRRSRRPACINRRISAHDSADNDTMRINRSIRAFSLTEMLFILALLSIASLLATRLFAGSMRVIRTAPEAQNYFAAVDRLAATLRRDVWAAARIDRPDERTLLLGRPDETSVR